MSPTSELSFDNLNFTTDGTTTAARITATAQTLNLSTGATLDDPVTIKGIQTPTDPEDAANKAYVDSQSSGPPVVITPGGNPTNVQFNDGTTNLAGATGINININTTGNLQLDEGKKMCFVDENTAIQAIPNFFGVLPAFLFESTQDNIVFEHNNTNGGGGDIKFLVQNSSSTANPPNEFRVFARDLNQTIPLLQINLGEMEIRNLVVKFNSDVFQIEGDNNNAEKFQVIKGNGIPILTIDTLVEKIQFPDDVPLVIGNDNNNFIKLKTNYEGTPGVNAVILQCNNNSLVFDNINPGNGNPSQEEGFSFILTNSTTTNSNFIIQTRDSTTGNIGSQPLVQITKDDGHKITNDLFEINVQDTYIFGVPSSQKFRIDENTQTIFQVNTLDKKVQIPGDDIELTFGSLGTSYIKSVLNYSLGTLSFPSALQIQNNQGLFVLEHESRIDGVSGGIYFLVDTDSTLPIPDQNSFLVSFRDISTSTVVPKLRIDRTLTTFYDPGFYEGTLIIGQDNEVDKFKILKNDGPIDTATSIFDVDTLNNQVRIPKDDTKLIIGSQGFCYLETTPDWPLGPSPSPTLDTFLVNNTLPVLLFEHKNTNVDGGIFFILENDANDPQTELVLRTRDLQTGTLSTKLSNSSVSSELLCLADMKDDVTLSGNLSEILGVIQPISPNNREIPIETRNMTVQIENPGFFLIDNPGGLSLFNVGVLQNSTIIASDEVLIVRDGILRIESNVEIVGSGSDRKLTIPSVINQTPGYLYNDVLKVDTNNDIVTIPDIRTTSTHVDMIIYQFQVPRNVFNGSPFPGIEPDVISDPVTNFIKYGFTTAVYENITTNPPWISYAFVTPSNPTGNIPIILQPGVYHIELEFPLVNARWFIAGIVIEDNALGNLGFEEIRWGMSSGSGYDPDTYPNYREEGNFATTISYLNTVLSITEITNIYVICQSLNEGFQLDTLLQDINVYQTIIIKKLE